MKILLVYPEYPETFWSFKYALKFISKKASLPPLGLLTVAALLPKEWEKKLVDMTITALFDRDIKWADYIFISAMSIQKESVKKIITQCKRLGTKIVAGGPLFTSGYPEYPETFWSFKYALKFISKKASLPPLGLLTVAALLPEDWEKKLVDMTVTVLIDRDIKWADYVFISAMSIQKESVKKIIAQCKRLGAKIVAGGPLFTSGYEDFEDDVDYFILNEAEITLPLFLEDLERGHLKHIYTSDQWVDLKKTPIPLWKLADINKYATMCIQYSRGCPFNCDFCDVTLLFGHKMRLKTKDQILVELESLYLRGWRGGVFIVDDNFIGNKRELKCEVLPAIINWMEERKYPFSFTTQASINLSDDEELIQLMVQAGFGSVFVGIETPNEESLAECNKLQNKNRDLIACVKKIQRFGLIVNGGFIMGFDNDTPAIFERLIEFIQKKWNCQRHGRAIKRSSRHQTLPATC